MKKFKIRQFDIANNLLSTDIVNGESKSTVSEWFNKQVVTVEGQILPTGIMQSNIFSVEIKETD